MLVVEYAQECGAECPGVADAPPTVPGTWGMCEIHNQWWQAVEIEPSEDGSPAYIWLQTSSPPWAVLVEAGLVPGAS